jgi:anti-anti-sigma factor
MIELATTAETRGEVAVVSKYGVSVTNGVCGIKLAGELDFANSEQVSDWLFGVIEKNECPVFELDLADLGFLDSSGISVLVVAARLVNRKGARLRAVNPQPAVRRVIDTTGVNTLLGLS